MTKAAELQGFKVKKAGLPRSKNKIAGLFHGSGSQTSSGGKKTMSFEVPSPFGTPMLKR